MTLSAPKWVSLMAMAGGGERIVEAHDKAVAATPGWIEKTAMETRLRDPAAGAMVRAGNQRMAAASFRHDTPRNLDPRFHTHAVIANMVQGEDGKWRTMVDDGLFHGKMASGAICRTELAQGLGELGYGIEKSHADGRNADANQSGRPVGQGSPQSCWPPSTVRTSPVTNFPDDPQR